MAIVNRDNDASQQAYVVNGSVSNTATGATYALCVVPHQAQLLAISQVAVGLSGAPNHSYWLQRFVAGVGVTSIAIGASAVAVVFGTSGAQSYSVVSGSSNLLRAGDVLMLSTAAANTAAAHVHVQLVLKALQDIKTHFGV